MSASAVDYSIVNLTRDLFVTNLALRQEYFQSYLLKLSRYIAIKINSAVLEQLAETDIRSVDKSTLVDINTIEFGKYHSKTEQIADYITKVKNPYCYLDNGMIVKISFSGRKNIEECIKNAMLI